MIRAGEYRQNTQLNSVFLVITFLFALLVFQSNRSIKTEFHKESVSIDSSVPKSSGTASSGIQFLPEQVYRISNKDNFELLSFGKIEFLENKKTEQRILLLKKIRYKSVLFRPLFIKSIPLPHESEELPVLS